MTQLNNVPVAFHQFSEGLSDDFRERIVHQALVFRPSASPKVRGRLRAAIRAEAAIRRDPQIHKGFSHDPSKAPPQRLVKPVAEATRNSDELMGAILRAWLEKQSALEQETRAFLSQGQMPVVGLADGAHAFPSSWPQSAMKQVADEFLALHPDHDWDDVALVLCCVSGQAKVSDEEWQALEIQVAGDNTSPNPDAGPDEPSPTALDPSADISEPDTTLASNYVPADRGQGRLMSLQWKAWLAAAEAWPAEAHEWTEVTDFISALLQLAEERRHERETGLAALRQELAAVQAVVRTAGASELLTLGLGDVPNWTVALWPSSLAKAVAEQLRQFHAELSEYARINQADAQTLASKSEQFIAKAHALQRLSAWHQQLMAGVVAAQPDLGLGSETDASGQRPTNAPIPTTAEPQTIIAAPATPLDSAVSKPAPVAHSIESPPSGSAADVATHQVAPVSETSVAVPTPDAQPPQTQENAPESPAAPETSVADTGWARAVEQAIAPTHAATAAQSVGSASIDGLSRDPAAITEPTPQSAAAVAADHLEYRELPPIVNQKVAKPADGVPLTVKEAAEAIREDEPKSWHHLIWALVAANDMPAAYWLARSLQARSVAVPAPDWLLAAIQGASWLSSDSDPLADDLFSIRQAPEPDDREVAELLAISATLKSVLVAPGTGFQSWLTTPRACPGMNDLVGAIQRYATTGSPLRGEILLGAAGAQQLTEDIRRAAGDAECWLQDAPNRRTKLPRATGIWREMVGPRGVVRRLLEPIADDRRSEVDRLRTDLARLKDREAILGHIREIDRDHTAGRTHGLVGDPRDAILRYVGEAYELAFVWCNLVVRERELSTSGRRLIDQAGQLREQVELALPTARLAVETMMAQPPANKGLVAAGHCVLRTLDQLESWIVRAVPLGAIALSWRELLSPTGNLHQALARRLLWLPEVDLDDLGYPTPAAIPEIAEILRTAAQAGRTKRTAFDGWLRKQDYRFVQDWWLPWMQDERDSAELENQYREALDGSRLALRKLVDGTTACIEQALYDGLIGTERAEYDSRLQTIKAEGVMNFQPVHAALRAIRDELGVLRDRRYKEQVSTWIELRAELDEALPDSARRDPIVAWVQKAMSTRDTRVLDECLAQVRRMLDTGGPFEINEPALAPSLWLESFLQAEPSLREWLRTNAGMTGWADQLRQGATIAGLNLATPQAREALDAVNAWRSLKQKGRFGNEHPDFVASILAFLGFHVSPRQIAVPAAVMPSPYLHLRAEMVPLQPLPVPQFGSQAHGHYDVICIWERQGADAIRAWLAQAPSRTPNAIVLYLAGLPLDQRRLLKRACAENGLAVLILDDILLAFLTTVAGPRLTAFFECTLPFAQLTPYAGTGHVPPEMFFGRADMINSLARDGGTCLVYGGRQLGKSALLTQVQSHFHEPAHERYAWVSDIKLVGDPLSQQPIETFWRQLRDGFKEQGLLGAKISTDKPEEIAKHLLDVVRNHPNRRVLVLLDEADNFLAADAKDGFQNVEQLRVLMAATARRFRVVFAGLHNVQRFQGIPNQPLSQFGTPLCVEPLEPTAAMLLVQTPLESLGYRFADSSVVLKILSYTNYHPGLIQLFCENLVKYLQSRVLRQPPPYRVEASDVEAVYRLEDVRTGIIDRFKWTLKLDPRYHVIAWTIILDQSAARDGYAQAYAEYRILSMVRDWWPQGFANVEDGEFRGLLDEMRGLGILVRSTDGYRLRSPNLVRLVSSASDVEDELLRLADKPAEVKFDADSHHALLEGTPPRYGSLTLAQERQLGQRKFGVGLVFGSDALGLDNISVAVERLVPSDLEEGRALSDCGSIPPTVGRSAGELSAWLRGYLAQHKRTERMVVYQVWQHETDNLDGRLREALEFCQRHQAVSRWVRVLFVAGPKATWRWLALAESDRVELESQVDACVSVRRWNAAGIRQRLIQAEKMDLDEICTAVLQDTGGWPILVDELFTRCRDRSCNDLRPKAQQLRGELRTPINPVAARLLRAIGLNESPEAAALARLITQEKSIPADLIATDLVCDQLGFSPPVVAMALAFLRRMACVAGQDGDVEIEPVLASLLTST